MNNLQIESNLLTRKEVCKILRVSYPTLKRWADSGVISSIKIGGTVRYEKAEIQRLLTNS